MRSRMQREATAGRSQKFDRGLLENIARNGMVAVAGGQDFGGKMKKLVVVVALAAALVQQPIRVAGAAQCYSPAAIEAEEAMRFVTDLMVASTSCRDTTYGLFQQRNKDAIIAYQKTLIAHYHGNAGFDKWHTSLANEDSMKEAGLSPAQACQQAADLMKTAATLDLKSFRAYAANLAANASARYTKCHH